MKSIKKKFLIFFLFMMIVFSTASFTYAQADSVDDVDENPTIQDVVKNQDDEQVDLAFDDSATDDADDKESSASSESKVEDGSNVDEANSDQQEDEQEEEIDYSDLFMDDAHSPQMSLSPGLSPSSRFMSFAVKSGRFGTWNYEDGDWVWYTIHGGQRWTRSKWSSWLKNNGFSNHIDRAKCKGIDVSEHNGNINWKAVKNSYVDFAFVRVGEGWFSQHGNSSHHKGDILDHQFKNNMKGANDNNIPVGVYYFARAWESPEDEAKFCLNKIKEGNYRVDLPIAIDVESDDLRQLSRNDLTNFVNRFSRVISNAGYTPMVYTSENWVKNEINIDRLDSNIKLWIAAYSIVPEGTTVYSRDIWQCGSQASVPGINGNVDINLAYVKYECGPNVSNSPTWRKNNKGWWYGSDANHYLVGKHKIDNEIYYFDQNGYMQTGWQYLDSTWYYFNSSGKMQTGWQMIDGSWFYLDSNGYMKTGWLQLGSNWFYLNSGGYMQTGWQLIDGSWFYFNGSGYMQTGWLQLGSNWFYLNSGGYMQTGWLKLGSNWFYLDSNGYMKTGWLKLGSSWFYLDSNGYMKTGWLKLGSSWFYLDNNGYMKTGWQKIGESWFYFNSGGYMQTGWQKIGGRWFYFNSDGYLKTT